MAEVTIKASAFFTKPMYFEHKKEDQVLLSKPTYNKSLAAEGYDNTLKGKLDVEEQDLVFYQDTPDSPVFLRELHIKMKDFRGIFLDLEFKAHDDKRIQKALFTALAKRHN